MADRGMAADLFRRAGFKYSAVDYAKFPGIIRLDLNVNQFPWWRRGRYQFVSNCGTSEHILNQYNVFKVIHDATASDGIMYHNVPGWGEYEHGIFTYTPKFFWALAKANDYKIIKYLGWSDGQPVPLSDEFMKQIQFSHAPICERIWLQVVLKKQSDKPFAGLNDPAFSSEVTTPRVSA